MAGKTALQNATYMTSLALLRETDAADALSAASAKTLIEAGDPVIKRLDEEISTGPITERMGLNYAFNSLLRLVVFPKTDGGALPGNIAVYARFRYLEKWNQDRSKKTLPDLVFVGKYPKGDAEGAIIVDIPNPPCDCELVVLADAAARIFYSQSV